MSNKGFIKTILVTPATLFGVFSANQNIVLKDIQNLATGDVASFQSDSSLVQNYFTDSMASEQTGREPFYANEKAVNRLSCALNGRGHFKPYFILKKEMSKVSVFNQSNFIISCALYLSDTENIALLDSITSSGDNYKKQWFRSLLDCLKNSDSPFLSFKARSLLKYHFNEE